MKRLITVTSDYILAEVNGMVKCLSYQERADGLCVLPTWTDGPPVAVVKPVDQDLVDIIFEDDDLKPIKRQENRVLIPRVWFKPK